MAVLSRAHRRSADARVVTRGVRSLLLVALMSLLFGALVAAPAAAQDNEEGDGLGSEDIPSPSTVPEETETNGEPGQDPGFGFGTEGEGGAPDEPDGAAPDEPAVEDEATGPSVREIVDDGDRSIQIIEVDDTGWPVIDVVVAVPPALAGELESGSFAMTENSNLQALSNVAKLRDVLEVVIVIDTSGSMDGEPLDSARTAAKEFVDQLDEDTRVAVVGFGATASTKAPFGSSPAEIAEAIDGLTAGGETALYDGLQLASDQFADTNARRFVVVLSDGTDTASSVSSSDVAASFGAGDVNLYAITLQSADADFSGLVDLAADVEGQVVAATDAASLRATYASVASRLTNQYRVTYRTSSPGEANVVISVDANEILAIARGAFDHSAVSGGAPAAVTDPATPNETGTDSTGSGGTVGAPDTSNPTVTTVPSDGSLLTSENALYLGAGGLFLGVLMALFVAFSAEPRGPSAFERLNFKPSAGASPRSGLASIADRATGVADRLLEKQEKRGALDSALERAGMDMRPGEYILTASAGAIGAGIFGFVMFSPRMGLIMFVVGAVFGKAYVGIRAGKRQKLFASQLGDTLMMIAGSLRAGHGVVEAIDTVASQAESPTAEEFNRATAEARIGRDMVESLYDIAERTQSEDFIWVVRAISINRELGGDLAEILDNVGETIRDRNRLRDQVKALSAEGKISAIILFVLPIGVAGYVQMTNAEYMASMTDQTAGKFVFGFACFALVAGGLWLKKLVKVDF